MKHGFSLSIVLLVLLVGCEAGTELTGPEERAALTTTLDPASMKLIKTMALMNFDGRFTKVNRRVAELEVLVSGETADEEAISGEGKLTVHGLLRGNVFELHRAELHFTGQLGAGDEATPIRGRGKFDYGGVPATTAGRCTTCDYNDSLDIIIIPPPLPPPPSN